MMCIKTSKIMGIKTLLDKDQKALLPAINDNLLMRVLFMLIKDYANHYAERYFVFFSLIDARFLLDCYLKLGKNIDKFFTKHE